jgi:hypothetical protein
MLVLYLVLVYTVKVWKVMDYLHFCSHFFFYNGRDEFHYQGVTKLQEFSETQSSLDTETKTPSPPNTKDSAD